MDYSIKIENVSKKFRLGERSSYYTLRDAIASLASKRSSNYLENSEFWALRNISFEVSPGEAIGIIGRNGSGKSTLLKILSRITPPTLGNIRIFGRVSSLLEVGTGFNQELTGRENIYLNGAILGMRRAEINRKFDEIVDFAGTEKFLDTPVKHYSSGMYIRLAFAIAAHLQTEILLMDEVLAVGDIAFQKKCLGRMEKAAHDGRTVVFVSHNMSAVRSLCSKTICLEGGKVIDIGDTEKVVNKYEKSAYQGSSQKSQVFTRMDKNLRNKFRIASVEVTNNNDKKTNDFVYNEIMKLHLRFEGKAEQDFSTEFHVYNESGQLISVGGSGAYHGIRFKKDTKEVLIEVGPLPLTIGRYSISLFIVYGIDGIGIERVDSWHEACFFQISQCQPFETTWEINSSIEGALVIPQKFYKGK